jgi:L-alanine-DL-glutamate epimerase-like enolase superfamily enzyme
MTRRLTVRHESWPIAGRFTISRGSKTAAEVVVAEIRDGDHIGRGECVPYGRYGETIAGVIDGIERHRNALEAGLDRQQLQNELAAGAARNAIDCALWDLAAKQSGRSAAELANLPPPIAVTTAYTLSLDSVDNMAAAARANAGRPLLKLKLAGPGDLERLRAVHDNAPNSRLIIDANEAWTPVIYREIVPQLPGLAVELIEQPFPADDDGELARLDRPVPVCADESCHDRAGLDHLAGRYDAINVKLDKTGGLTEALALVRAAQAAELAVMVGCMVATSLAMAPALLLAQGARWVDLDGPLLLAGDREPGLRYDGSLVHPAGPALWG